MAVALIIGSFIVLVPGITLEIMSIKISSGPFVIFDKSQSILSFVDSLYQSKSYLVAALILLFSVIVPFAKGVLLLVVFFLKDQIIKWRLFQFICRIGKWSMADVFIVGIYMAYLASKGTANMDARVQPGFFFFLAYCIISLLAMEFMKIENPGEKNRGITF